ncbi:MAG: DUF1761 domain-containing protein [Patescibacteria group bacterium]
MNYITDINLLSVLVAGVAAMAIGFLWYGPFFGKVWMRESYWTENELAEAKKGMGANYFMSFITALVMAIVLEVLINGIGINSVTGGLKLTFIVWLGLLATVKFNDKLFSKNKSITLFWIDSGHYLAVMLAMGAILTFL